MISWNRIISRIYRNEFYGMENVAYMFASLEMFSSNSNLETELTVHMLNVDLQVKLESFGLFGCSYKINYMHTSKLVRIQFPHEKNKF